MATDLPKNAADATRTIDPGQEKQTLKFLFTPRDALAGELEKPNPHAKASTQQSDVIEALQERFGEQMLGLVEYAGEQTVYLDRAVIADACRFLKAEQGYGYLSDMGSVDRFTEADRFEVFYSLVNIERKKRLRLKVRVDEEDPVVPTITGIHRAATWHEREVWDMMGVRFEGHPDLRRMFLPEDFEYHPARKEFPTLGIPGSLPLPPNETDGSLQLDPFPRAHGDLPED
ncbi:MAG: NADH-quinone oxidoreductase subunit C [Rhodothermaceae bacterium]|nr:NADH-quinone oxidoreductase subunit C [Rhodothermaceae bacterium]